MACSDALRVLVADDNENVRQTLEVLFSIEDDLELVGMARNGQQAVELCRDLEPDIVLMDLIMPEVDGVKATQNIHHDYPDIRILILTSTVEYDRILEALQAGATGYLYKSSTVEDITETIRQVGCGNTIR